FTRLNIPNYVKPAVGGLAVGVIGMFFPYILGTGYGWIQRLILMEDEALTSIYFIVAMIVAKIFVTSLTVGSGGSGGAFAPSLVIGGFTGALIWSILDTLNIPTKTSLAAFVMVGMMAFFGGVGKAPISAILMVSEMSGTYSLLVPSMVATVIAYVITGKHTIYASQVPTRRDSPAHSLDYAIPLLTQIKVKDAMTPNPISITPETMIEDAMKIMLDRKIRGLPVVKDGRLVGVVTHSDLLRAKVEGRHNIPVDEIMTRRVTVALPDETLFSAFDKMTEKGIGRLPVVDSQSSMRLVGIITRGDIGHVYELSVQRIIKAKQEEMI
ncbi:MAG TPA: CBS domain-containing protein, partial [Candidatus Caldiarchaeum subterraneum]|nr:CBS domain-containing protein [Candidatus Caldarchaeum subterraneum]